MPTLHSILAPTLLALAYWNPALATVDDALSFAYEAALPYVKQGFTVREEVWGGDLGIKDQKAITVQLFRGNEYLFILASDVRRASLTVSIYNSQGQLAQSEAWQRGRTAAAKIVPQSTGTYYAIVTLHRSPLERTPWALIYAYR